jgi:hypothetical protein
MPGNGTYVTVVPFPTQWYLPYIACVALDPRYIYVETVVTLLFLRLYHILSDSAGSYLVHLS